MTTWYCRSTPPITVTCDTPSTASSRLRTANSPRVRSRIAWSSFSWGVAPGSADRRATIMTSPMIDEIGAIVTLASAGSRSRASCSFSDTTCRSR